MTAPIPALTVWQPWASLIAEGVKPYEFRGWPAPKAYRGQRIAIHAGSRPVRLPEVKALIYRMGREDAWTTALKPEALEILRRISQAPTSLILGAVVCTAVLGNPVPSDRIMHTFGGPKVNDSDRDQHCNWAWPLTDIQRLEPPEPARGAQGFWKWTPNPFLDFARRALA